MSLLRCNSYSIVKDAVEGNQMNVLKWIECNKPHCISTELQQDKRENECNYVCLAAYNANLCMVKWLILKGFSYNSKCCVEAVSSGSLDILQYLLSLNCVFEKEQMFPTAAVNSFNKDILDCLFKQGCPFMEEESFSLASYAGNFEFIKWIKSHGSTAWDVNIKKKAAAQGNLEALQWALDQDKAYDFDNCVYVLSINAASGGHLHVIEWLKTNLVNFCWDPQVCVVAARGGHIELLQWAITNGCNWDIYKCCIAAIENSRLEVLIWIKTIDHNIFSCTCLYNLYSKRNPNARAINTDVLKWLQINGFSP